MQQFSSKYDLEERMALLGERIITVGRKIKQDTITKPVINQLVRSGTSVEN